MTTLPELLKDADPLSSEPIRSAHDRQLRRQVVLALPPVAGAVPRRAFGQAAFAAVAFTAIAAGGLYWSRASVDVLAAVRFEVRLAEDAFSPGLQEVVVSGAGRRIYLHRGAIVTNSDIARAQLAESNGSMYGVSLTLKPEGAARMRRATEGHLGKPVAILIEGTVVMAPTVRSPIGAEALISGDYTKADAERIVAGIIGR